MSLQESSSNLATHYRDVRSRLNTAHVIRDRSPVEMEKTPIVFSFSTFNRGLPIAGFYGEGRWMTGVRRQNSIASIMAAVCNHFDITENDLLSSRQPRHLVRPRHVAMYLCKAFTTANITVIGKKLRRDHTTVMHGLRKVEKDMHTDPILAAAITELSEQFRRSK